MSHRKTTEEILEKKRKGEKITMLTAYDFPMADLIDKADIDMILVGDSLANVVLGLEDTKEVGMEEMIHHAKAVNRGVQHAMLIGDMPFESYQEEPQKAVQNAKRFVEEAGCGAVKLEWFDQCLRVAADILRGGIPVMGHVGLTPQTADQLGGFIVQGRDTESAKRLIEQAKELERVGCFSIVLECVPDKIARIITEQVKVPTIGIGAGVFCDGQVLVTHDLLGLFDRFRPKFAKKYVDTTDYILKAIGQFRDEVKLGRFPDAEHSFTISDEVVKKLKKP